MRKLDLLRTFKRVFLFCVLSGMKFPVCLFNRVNRYEISVGWKFNKLKYMVNVRQCVQEWTK